MPHMNRLNLAGWYYCPVHSQMENWSLGSCIAVVDAGTWDDYVTMLNEHTVLRPVGSYDVVEHGPDPISIR